MPFLTCGANLRISRNNISFQLWSCCWHWGHLLLFRGLLSSTWFIPQDDSLWQRFLGRDKAPGNIPALPFPAECQAGVSLEICLEREQMFRCGLPKALQKSKSPSKNDKSCCLDPLMSTDPKLLGFGGEKSGTRLFLSISAFTC